MRWKWTACAVVAAAAAISFAQDATPPGDRLVVKARITGAKLTARDDVLLLPWFDGDVPSGMNVEATLNVDSGVLQGVVAAPKLQGSGLVQLSLGSHPEIGCVLAFAQSMRGELDLGEIALDASATTLAAGRVVTRDGKAAYGATVLATCRISKFRSFRFGELTATTDESGAFRIAGIVRGGGALTFELGVEEGWTVEKPVPFTAGAKDLKVVATRTSGVHGTVVVPEDLPLADLVVMLNGPPGGVAQARPEPLPERYTNGSEVLQFPATAKFCVTGLLPGTYDVRLKFAGSSRWLARLPEVTIDDTASDLPPLEVKDPIGHVKARVASADGAIPAGAELLARNEGDHGKFRRIALGADASADVAFVGDGVTLAAHAEGTDFVVVQPAKSSIELTLPKPEPTPVTVEVSGEAQGSAADDGPSIVLQWQAAASVPEGQLQWAKDDTDPRNGTEVVAKLPPKGPVLANVTVAGWYGIGVRVKSGGTTFTRCGLDRLRVELGKPASARVQISREDLSSPDLPPRVPPPK